ncbi:sodium/potassium exporting P-type ATPase 1-like [Physcomitrium patens]|uniref:Cation-transporting P-type ATPase N-terminal domain-containing protein n=1 Tax=Physcomitrium patens TaxID=3218 RepID=A0A2K1K1N0_PHYPA|nr:hypothetical protein PHYPA_012162 [Physcomitrium patens]
MKELDSLQQASASEMEDSQTENCGITVDDRHPRELMEVSCNIPCASDSKSFTEVSEVLDSTSELGLSNAEPERLLSQCGRNEHKGQGTVNPWKLLLEQVADDLTAVLTIATVVSFYVKSTM